MEKISKNVRDYILIFLGTICLAISVNVVYEPMDMVTGGLTGLAIILKDLIPIWLTTIIINIPLFIVAIKLKGKKFINKTLFATICFIIALYFIPSYEVVEKDLLLSAIFGGTIGGIGLGLVFLADASTGGTDLLGVILQKFIRHYSVPTLLMIIDGGIVLLGALVFGINKALYAIIAVVVTSKVMDNILEGFKFSKAAYIISDNYEIIAIKILKELDRGVTGLYATGMYSKKDKKILLCVVSKKEIVRLTELVSENDKNAFVIVHDTREVLGEGFIEYRQ